MFRFVLATSLFLGCGASYVVDTSQELYTLTNLRPNARGQMTSVLQWRGSTVLPVCTKVQLTLVRNREVRFRDASTGRQYRYIMHRSSRGTVEDHVNRYFGAQCPNLAAYSPVDQQGIQAGQPIPGMSKEAVVLALGYPPEHRTPTLEGPTWTYWGTRGHVQVQFNGDMVASVNDPANPQGEPVQVQPQPQPQPQPAGPTVIGPDGYPVSNAPPPAPGSSVTVQAQGGYPAQTGSATVTVQPATAPAATVTVQTTNDSRRARRRRRRRRATVGVAVGGAVAGAAVSTRAANNPPPTRTRTVRRSSTMTSGCRTLTINGSVYSDHPGGALGQSCDGGGCPASYVCSMPMGVCVTDDGQRCR